MKEEYDSAPASSSDSEDGDAEEKEDKKTTKSAKKATPKEKQKAVIKSPKDKSPKVKEESPSIKKESSQEEKQNSVSKDSSPKAEKEPATPKEEKTKSPAVKKEPSSAKNPFALMMGGKSKSDSGSSSNNALDKYEDVVKKSRYHPIEDACWKKGEKTPYLVFAKTLQVNIFTVHFQCASKFIMFYSTIFYFNGRCKLLLESEAVLLDGLYFLVDSSSLHLLLVRNYPKGV